MSFDLNKFDTTAGAAQGAFLHLESPDGELLYVEDGGEKKAVGFMCIGSDAPAFQKAQHKLQDRRTDNMRIKGGKIKGLSAAQSEADATALLAMTITEYVNLPQVDGEVLTCSRENSEMLLERFPWMREQVDEFTSDRSNFLGE